MIVCKHTRYKTRYRVTVRGKRKYRAYCKSCRTRGKASETREEAIISLRQKPQWFY